MRILYVALLKLSNTQTLPQKHLYIRASICTRPEIINFCWYKTLMPSAAIKKAINPSSHLTNFSGCDLIYSFICISAISTQLVRMISGASRCSLHIFRSHFLSLPLSLSPPLSLSLYIYIYICVCVCVCVLI